MSVAIPKPSSRFVRAAAIEREDLTRHRDRLSSKREALLDELRQLDEAMARLDQRLLIIEQLLESHGQPVPGLAERAPRADQSEKETAAVGSGMQYLRGPAIREAAIQVLLSQPEYIEAIHYRRWFELLTQAGYTIAGKKPEAVFLTQITRSPVVRKAGAPGIYELDRQAPLRLRQRLERLRSELRELSAAAPRDSEMASARARRHDLDVAIGQQERALEEALRVLRRGGDAEHAQIADVAEA